MFLFFIREIKKGKQKIKVFLKYEPDQNFEEEFACFVKEILDLKKEKTQLKTEERKGSNLKRPRTLQFISI